MLVAINLKKVRDKQPIKKTKDPPKFKIGYLVLLKNHKEQNCDTKFPYNDRAYDLQDTSGHIVLEHNLGCSISQHVDAKQLRSPTKQSQAMTNHN